MKETRFNGYLINTTLDGINSGINKIINKNEITSERIIEGEEIHLISTKLELYIYSNKNEPGDFLMNREYFDSIHEAISLFKLWGAIHRNTKLKYEFEIYQENELGDQIGESIILKN